MFRLLRSQDWQTHLAESSPQHSHFHPDTQCLPRQVLVLYEYYTLSLIHICVFPPSCLEMVLLILSYTKNDTGMNVGNKITQKPHSSWAVSYTHLDVYKRQSLYSSSALFLLPGTKGMIASGPSSPTHDNCLSFT